jgi:mRNA interferase MazF
MTTKPKVSEIWLVRFPFSDLTSTKLRPALILAMHREEFIILGIFSKIPSGELYDT